jgi:hypothetical protein
MLGVVTTALTAADYDSLVLGIGMVKLLVADESGSLSDMLSPESGSDGNMSLPCFNSAERDVVVDEPVGLTIVLGVGLVASPLRCPDGSGS